MIIKQRKKKKTGVSVTIKGKSTTTGNGLSDDLLFFLCVCVRISFFNYLFRIFESPYSYANGSPTQKRKRKKSETNADVRRTASKKAVKKKTKQNTVNEPE
jgi:hypothetical protein